MERGKGVTLRGLFVRYLILTGVLAAAIALVWWGCILHAIQAGFVLPAYTGERAARAAAERMRETGALDESVHSSFFDYVLLDESGDMLESSLAVRAQERVKKRLEQGREASDFEMRVPLAEGRVCLLLFDYNTPYGNEALRGRLPNFQVTMFVLLVAGWGTVILLTALSFSRRLKRQIDLLSGVAARVAREDLDFEVPHSGVQEIGEVLDAMGRMKDALKESLSRQWSLEQQRREQMQSLVHDLRTPLTVIEGNAELLQEDGTLDAGQRRCAEAIVQSAESARAYVKELRGALYEETGALNRQKTELSGWVQGFLKSARTLCEGAGLSFQAEASGFAVMDAQAMQRAVMNLIDNAARFAPAGGRVRLRAEQLAAGAVFIVEDTGPGFTKDALAHGQERFFRDERARGQDGHYGLGLYSAAQTAERHGGRMKLENAEAGGARVTIWIDGTAA